MLVEVAYPSPVLYRAKGARRQSLAFVRDRAPVDLVEVRDADMEPVAFDDPDGPPRDAFGNDAGTSIALHEGEAWIRLRDMGSARFAAILAGDGTFTDDANLSVRFQRTPLVAHVVHEGRSINRQCDGTTRGDPFDVSGIREIVADGRGRDVARLASFLRDEFRLGQDAVWTRYRPVVAIAGHNGSASLHTAPVLIVSGLQPVSPWHVGEALAVWGVDAKVVEAPLRLAARLPERPDCLDDVLRLANWAAVKTRAHVTADAGMYGRWIGEDGRRKIAETVAPLAAWEVAGATGAIGPDDAGAVLGHAARAFAIYGAGVHKASHLVGETGRLEAYVEGVALPRIAERLERRADLDALMAI